MIRKKIINAFLKKYNVRDEDAVILEYGLSKMFMFLEDVVFTLVLGYLLGIIIESIVFQTLFILLRMYAGGYHSETEEKCKIYSALVTVSSLVLIKFLPDGTWLSFLFILAASALISILAPVEAVKKPLSDAERKIYCKRAVIITVIADVILAFDLILGGSIFYKPIMVGLYGVCIFMVIGKISNKRAHETKI
ncbi:MAG: accessory gene regulator B family protein [Lachnospiraceae bacterium]|nr:accessory gene regulator B family protein [Lachnospiraceae bacterium]